MFKNDIIIFECVVQPQQMINKIDTFILKYAKNELVNKCTGYGFIKEINKIHKKSEGYINPDGDVIYTIWLDVLICNPEIGSEIECKITDKDSRIGKPMMKKEPLLVILFSNKEYEIGDNVIGIITDKRIDKTNNMINLLVDIKET